MEKSLTSNLDRALPTAAGRLAALPKVTPEVMMIVYLDEIAGRLAELQDTMAEMNAEGDLKHHYLTIPSEPVRIPLLCRHFSLHNDGPNSVFVMQHPGKPFSNDASVEKDGELNLDFGTRRQRSFWLVCNATETASVKIFTW